MSGGWDFTTGFVHFSSTFFLGNQGLLCHLSLFPMAFGGVHEVV